MFAFLTLASGKSVDEWDAPLYEDISKILTVGPSADVESADIPIAMDKLASIIAKHQPSSLVQQFIHSSTSPSGALELILKSPPLKEALDELFAKHGHRCYAEMDLMRQSWKTEPLPLISLLQSMVNNKIQYPNSSSWSSGSTKYSSTQQLLDSLNTKLSLGARRFLKFLLKYDGTAVGNRENTKSLLVRTINELKLVYNHLAGLLVAERLLSDPKLICFMTHYEIGLVVSRDVSISRVLYKAMRRQKLHAQLDKESCSEIVIGTFEPVDDAIHDVNLELGDTIHATPLSSGKVQATVKVCRSVAEATQILKPCDIFITSGTDIAWSPFFPMLGGIITELGGLTSHGAVVAREYGLPCLVGAESATKIFQTGDEIILDAKNGTATRVNKK